MEKEEEKKLEAQSETDAQAVKKQELSEEELDSVAGGYVPERPNISNPLNIVNPNAIKQ